MRLDSFAGDISPFDRGRVLRKLVEALADADECFLRAYHVPLLYEAGVRYVNAHDEWRDVPRVLEARGGDCKDLTAWRCAELRILGRQAVPRIILQEDDAQPGKVLYHVIVQSGGRFEDPSRILGMP